eukprot:1158449-Pelagomonas_calceolata.AAC.10
MFNANCEQDLAELWSHGFFPFKLMRQANTCKVSQVFFCTRYLPWISAVPFGVKNSQYRTSTTSSNDPQRMIN